MGSLTWQAGFNWLEGGVERNQFYFSLPLSTSNETFLLLIKSAALLMMIVGGKTNLWFGLDQVIGYYFLFKICGRLSIQVTNADKLNQDVEIRRIRENLILEAHTQVQSAIHPWWTNQPVVQWLARCNDGETIAFSGDVPLVCLTVCCALPVVTGMGRDDGGTLNNNHDGDHNREYFTFRPTALIFYFCCWLSSGLGWLAGWLTLE